MHHARRSYASILFFLATSAVLVVSAAAAEAQSKPTVTVT